MRETQSDPFDLQRFVDAQTNAYREALGELKAGRKRSHWIWFIFPQVAGLGFSSMAQRYAIASRREALAYRAHPLLGPRLLECTAALLAVEGKSATEIMGPPDDVKLRSSLTLFAAISAPGSAFHVALARFFSGEGDARTLDYLARHA